MKPMLAGAVEFVIGVDTHRDTHTAAIVNAATGGQDQRGGEIIQCIRARLRQWDLRAGQDHRLVTAA